MPLICVITIPKATQGLTQVTSEKQLSVNLTVCISYGTNNLISNYHNSYYFNITIVVATYYHNISHYR